MIKKTKNLKNICIAWFTVSRVIVTIWNLTALLYHALWIGIDIWTSLTIQGTTLLVDYLLCGWYEKMLIASNNKINGKTMFAKWRVLKRMVAKHVAFTSIFVLIYVSTYSIRLAIFYRIGFGIDSNQLKESIINMVIFTLIAGPVMAAIVLERKKKGRSNRITPQKK
ncbi:MAG: hypothetical protein WCL18_05190 [bacterium]